MTSTSQGWGRDLPLETVSFNNLRIASRIKYVSNSSRRTDQGRAELNQYVVTLLHTIVTLMANSTSSHQIVLPKLPIMLSTSENTRTGVLSSMGSQYQRLLQTVPLSSWNMSYQGNGTDGAQETLNGKLEELHISARSDAFGSSGIGANIGSPSKTTFPRAPRIVDLRLEKGNAKEKISEPKLEAPACISQANNEVSGKASKPVVAAPSNKPSTTDVATSSTAVEKAKFPPCGEALAWEISDGQPRYKCSKCDFNIKLETMQSYFLEFRTKDGFKIRVDNKDIWDSHAKCYTPKVPLCVCKLCQNSVYFLVSLKDHFKTHTKEEVLLSYPGAHVLK
jgi:hypothetical protein